MDEGRARGESRAELASLARSPAPAHPRPSRRLSPPPLCRPPRGLVASPARPQLPPLAAGEPAGALGRGAPVRSALARRAGEPERSIEVGARVGAARGARLERATASVLGGGGPEGSEGLRALAE